MNGSEKSKSLGYVDSGASAPMVVLDRRISKKNDTETRNNYTKKKHALIFLSFLHGFWQILIDYD